MEAQKDLAELLSFMFDTEIKTIDGGWRIKETPTHYIDVLNNQILNFRIARTQKICMMSYDRAWCYYGRDLVTFLRAVQAAVEWDGADNTAPEGWDKNATTGEYAHPDKYQGGE